MEDYKSKQDRLALAYKETGSDADFRALLKIAMTQAHKMALGMSRGSLEYEELMQEAKVALVKCIAKWDPEKSIFYTYYSMWLKAFLMDYARRNSKQISVGGGAARRKAQYMIIRGASDETIMSDTGVTAEALAELRGVIDAEFSSFNNEEIELIENVQDVPEARKLIHLLVGFMDGIIQRDREIFIAKAAGDIGTASKLARKYGITDERVRQIYRSVSEIVGARMKKAGYSLSDFL